MEFPDISLTSAPFQNFPDIFFKFPDNFLTLKKYFFPDFSLMCGNPVKTVTAEFHDLLFGVLLAYDV